MRVLALVAAVNSLSATTGFNFGKGSGIIVLDGTLDLTNGARIVDGFIENNGGSIATDCTPIVGTNATWADRDGSYYSSITFDGCLHHGNRVNLGNNQMLVMDGSVVPVTPIVSGHHCEPTIIRGVGGVVEDGEIRIDSGATANVNLSGVLTANINLKGNRCEYSFSHPGNARAVLSLANDLTFAPLYGPTTRCVTHPGVNRIEFNGNRMTFGGDADALDCHNGSYRLPHAQVWNDANVLLSGPVVFGSNGSVTFDSPGYVNGSGNTLFLGEALKPLINTYNEVNLSNLTINGDSTGDWFAYGQGAWNCVNTTLVRSGYNILRDGDSGIIVDSNTGATVYVEQTTGGYVVFNEVGQGSYVDLVATDVLDGDSRVFGTRGALFAASSNEGSIWYNGDSTDSFVRFFDGVYVVVTIAFIDAEGDFEKIANQSITIDGAFSRTTNVFGDTRFGHSDTVYERRDSFCYSNLQDGSNNDIFDGCHQVYVDDADNSYFKFDGEGNPVYVTLDTAVTYDGESLITGVQGTFFANDSSGSPIWYDGESEGMYVQYNGTIYYRVTIDFNRVLDVNGNPVIDVHYNDEDIAVADATVRLNTDVSIFGEWTVQHGTTLTIDLNGHALDLSNGSLRTNSCESTMVIKNGTLKGLSCESLDFHSGSTLILENVELHLGSHVRWDNAELKIKGKCRFVGRSRSVFDNQSTANFTITPNSTLTLEDGVIYSHNNNGETNFNFCNSSSHLELMGATFRRPDAGCESSALELTVGTIIIDHKSVMQPGSNGIQFGDGDDSDNNLSIIVRPGATLSISSDNCADVSSGTITYANVSSC